MYPFRCHARSLTFVLRQVIHCRLLRPSRSWTSASVPSSLTPHRGLDIVLCGDPAQLAPVWTLPLYVYQGHMAPRVICLHRFRTIVELDPDQPFRQTGSDDTQTQFHTLFGRTSNCQAIEDDWQLQTCHPTCLSAEKNGSVRHLQVRRCHTSVNALTTNSSPPLRFLTYVRVPTTMTANVPTMTIPPNALRLRKYGPHSRPRDEMGTKENVAGPTLDDEERITCVLFSLHSPLLTVQRNFHLPASQPHLGPALLATGTPSLPDTDLSIVPPTVLSTRSKGKRKAEN